MQSSGEKLTWRGRGSTPSRRSRVVTTCLKSAPSRSSLFTNAIAGISCFCVVRHTVSENCTVEGHTAINFAKPKYAHTRQRKHTTAVRSRFARLMYSCRKQVTASNKDKKKKRKKNANKNVYVNNTDASTTCCSTTGRGASPNTANDFKNARYSQ